MLRRSAFPEKGRVCAAYRYAQKSHLYLSKCSIRAEDHRWLFIIAF
ncbi:hypothetical protein HMPREF9436_00944 [Faecalibacterium cf. prausnitzii KLE1255]|uniref:Uncharacterized protein n=1 Tax=Faecalibacterium cf. prausnitzii KLE1255 TaxID=748224 RepID=E2ZH06_9FIRM|nr:hypothetical protein HMPREF9436_00944 [Faecalibacterium cf. prausnitzii KLE1255]